MEPGTIWLLLSTALVIFMTPGLAFFYGGLVRAKSVVSMMMLSFGALGLVAVLWILYGYNMGLLGDSGLSKYVANPFSDFGLFEAAKADDATLAGIAFGSSFAIITVALISGAIADRARFFPWLVFAGLWATIVYFPVQAWVWNADNGWIYNLFPGGNASGVLDWAGGTAVHINAGAAALALALVLGQRVGFSKELQKPHNVPLVLIGAAILWFGWFGFNDGLNGGEASSGLIFVNTLGAPAAAILGWILVEHFKNGKATAVGAASGAVAGLVAITPACAHLAPLWAMVLGLLAGSICALAVELKYKLGFDDSLDVVGIHLVGGIIGCWFLGFFAQYAGSDADTIDTGLFYGGGIDQLVTQVVSSLAVLAYSFIVAYVLGTIIDKTIGFRIKEDEEAAGIDSVLHGESGYALD